MSFVELCQYLVMYVAAGCIVVSLFILSSDSFLETTPPNYLIKDILFWPALVCGFIVGIIERYKEK